MSLFKNTPLLFFPLLAVVLLCTIFTLISQTVQSQKHADYRFTVVIDAGHGGMDSGKVGIDGTLEKDVNLSIAKKLEQLLQDADIEVIMTRTRDCDLSDEDSANKKRRDMQNRLQLLNASNADCVVSIHQNSYPDASVAGAQVFYHTASQQGKELAALLQKQLIQRVDPSNHRLEKSDSTYYLLKNSTAPMVIVECGFLSNPSESKKLMDDTYQQKLAWAIHLGILQYLNNQESNSHI